MPSWRESACYNYDHVSYNVLSSPPRLLREPVSNDRCLASACCEQSTCSVLLCTTIPLRVDELRVGCRVQRNPDRSLENSWMTFISDLIYRRKCRRTMLEGVGSIKGWALWHWEVRCIYRWHVCTGNFTSAVCTCWRRWTAIVAARPALVKCDIVRKNRNNILHPAKEVIYTTNLCGVPALLPLVLFK